MCFLKFIYDFRLGTISSRPCKVTF